MTTTPPRFYPWISFGQLSIRRGDKDKTSDYLNFPPLYIIAVQGPPWRRHVYASLVFLDHELNRVTDGFTTGTSHQSKSSEQSPASRRVDARSSRAGRRRPWWYLLPIPPKGKDTDQPRRTIYFSVHDPFHETCRPAIKLTAIWQAPS